MLFAFGCCACVFDLRLLDCVSIVTYAGRYTCSVQMILPHVPLSFLLFFISLGSAATINATGEPTVKPFNRNFVRALDEFIDRLGVTGEFNFSGSVVSG